MPDLLLVETGKPPLIFGDQLRIEGRQSVARNFKLDLAGLGENRFSAIAVPAVATAVLLALVEMMIYLGVQGSFGKRLLQAVEQAVFYKGRFRVGSRQKLIKQLVGNSRLLPSRHTMSPSFPSLWPSHEIYDRPGAAGPMRGFARRLGTGQRQHFRHHAGRKRRSAWLARLVTQEALYPSLAVAPLPAPNGRAADSGWASDFGDRHPRHI